VRRSPGARRRLLRSRCVSPRQPRPVHGQRSGREVVRQHHAHRGSAHKAANQRCRGRGVWCNPTPTGRLALGALLARRFFVALDQGVVNEVFFHDVRGADSHAHFSVRATHAVEKVVALGFFVRGGLEFPNFGVP
jgi:hypothetical protein